MANLLAGTKIAGVDVETTTGAQNKVNAHSTNSTVHLSAAERTKWNKGHDLHVFKDTRKENPTPAQCRANGAYEFRDFKEAVAVGIDTIYAGGTYVMLATMCGYTDKSGGPVVQFAYCPNGNVFRRLGKPDDTSWNQWVNILDANTGMPKSGGNFTGDIAIDKGIPCIGFNVPGTSYNSQIYLNASTAVNYGLIFNVNSAQAMQILSERSVKIKTEGGSWYDINHLVKGQAATPTTVQNGLFIAVYE